MQTLPRLISLVLLFSLVLSFPLIPPNPIIILPSSSLPDSLSTFEQLSSDSTSDSLSIPSSIRIITRGGHLPSFNPFIDLTFIFPFMSLVYDPLIGIDPATGEYTPGLAKQWVVTADSMEWTLYLRDDVVFHNGAKFNATIVKETFDRVLQPLHPESLLPESFFSSIDSCIILDEFIVKVIMKEPGSPFDRDFPSIAYNVDSDDLYLVNGTEGFTPRGGGMIWPIGTGPYRLDSLSTGINFYNFTFTRFDNHFRGLAPFQTIYCLFYPNPSDYDSVISSCEGELAERFVHSFFIDDQYWEKAPRSYYNLMGHFNFQREELTNPLVRLALNYAINRLELVNQVEGLNNRDFLEFDVNPAVSVLPRIPDDYESILGYSFNLQLSNILLDLAGYPRDSNGHRFNLTISSPSYQTYVQETLISAFDSLGIGVITSTHSLPNYQLFEYVDIFTFDSFDGITYYDLLHSNGNYNYGGFSDLTIDFLTLLEKQTPIRQEKRFYEELILQQTQELAPYLLLLNGRMGCIKAKSISSLIHHSPNGFYLFNYTSPSSRIMEDIALGTQPLYFPFTDNILQAEENIIVTTLQSNNLHFFLPEFNQQGKYFNTMVSNQNVDYHFRCYYESEDINSIPVDQLTLFSWDSDSEIWKELVPYSTNSSLHFVEVVIQGDIIARFGRRMIETTFRFLPIVSLFIVSMMVIIGFTLIYNQKTTTYLLRRYIS